MSTNLLDNYYFLAGSNAFLWSLALILYRFVMSKGADARTLVIVGQLGACLFLVGILGLPDYFSLSWNMLSLLAISGLLWALGVFLEIAALEYLEATASGIIGALRYLLGFLIGIVILGESLNAYRVVGALLIVGAILGISSFSQVTFRKGFWITVLGVIFQISAYGIDKRLAEQLPAATVAISSYIFPGVTFLLLYPRRIFNVRDEFVRSRGMLPFLPVLIGLCYLAVIKAFAQADFVAVLAIAESSLLFTCFFAYFILGERDRPLRKVLCSIGCLVGVVMICAG